MPTSNARLNPLTPESSTSMAHAKLFQQIVSDTQKLLRLKLKLAQGDTSVQPEIDELNQAISLKQALLNGLKPSSGND